MVIVILAILPALLLPVLSWAKSAAHKALCLNNQREIDIARQLYATDNEGHLVPLFKMDSLMPPFPDLPSNFYSFAVKWQDILCDSYLDRNTDLFECPAGARKLVKMLAMVRSGHLSVSPSRLQVTQLEKD